MADWTRVNHTAPLFLGPCVYFLARHKRDWRQIQCKVGSTINLPRRLGEIRAELPGICVMAVIYCETEMDCRDLERKVHAELAHHPRGGRSREIFWTDDIDEILDA